MNNELSMFLQYLQDSHADKKNLSNNKPGYNGPDQTKDFS